ncbi:PREDICTED: transmembrane protease serine 9-like [Papilio xuthus]|uniref:Transmembrane protease serine 9-like n=1 Tax=Papilio xuthus TaxID=66420 RepID=A0AAJ6ZHP9_PAPXU|nr:PREDICTED: transmembrane protease serine 9-like [Papilio xuthus]
MKVLVIFAVLAVAANAKSINPLVPDNHSAYGYLQDVGVPEAERIQKAEEAYLRGRITGGVPAALGQIPYQAGLITDIIGITGRGVCGGTLISPDRVLTAAHCWYDGRHQAWRVTVVLGSVLLFSGGNRQQTSVVAMHPNWVPFLVRNDIGVIYLHSPVAQSATSAPIALPSDAETENTFAGYRAIASGFGATSTGANITTNQYLSQVNLNVISNNVCNIAFPSVIQASNLCTSGLGGVGVCGGDSGGPLVTTYNGRQIVIGVTSFGIRFGCDIGYPSAFARVTSFLDFIRSNLSEYVFCYFKMKLLLALVATVALANARFIEPEVPEYNTAYGYMQNYGIPLAQAIYKAELENNEPRIIGGSAARLGQFPYQAGLISDIVGTSNRGVCGGSLVTTSRVVTAAHCWFDGRNQGWRFTVVLGSITLFSGGTRLETTNVVMHNNWNPSTARNDVAVIRLNSAVSTSANIATIALPTGSQLNENFAGNTATASGFGLTRQNGQITTSQFLSFVNLNVITNSVCTLAFPLIVQSTNICTSGSGGRGVCGGDSGGPLTVVRNNRPLLIGITSFGSGLGCERNLPSAYARVTSFVNFINQNI